MKIYVQSHGGRTFVPKPKSRKCKPRGCEINLIYQNVRGLRSKTHTFNKNVEQNGYDIIALTETFLNSSVSDGELFPMGYHVVRNDRAGDVGWRSWACSAGLL